MASILSLISTLLLFSLTLRVSAVYQGFNYGSTWNDNTPLQQADFEREFNNAKQLIGAPDGGFHSARLFTMIQGGTTNTPTSAIPAAIQTNTTLLLGMWASAGDAAFSNEISALRSAIQQYGPAFTSLVVGVSVGSEDLYRITPTGIQNKAGVGVGPDVLVNYISQTRSVLTQYNLSPPVTHVDTWTAWVNTSNNAVIDACDVIGMDAYPYFQNSMENSIEKSNQTFYDAYYQTVGAVNARGKTKPVWVTETGWPVSGPTENLAVASVSNAQTYWKQTGCSLFGNINTWWYTMLDAYPNQPTNTPSFGIVGSNLSTTPLFNISC